MHTVTHQFYESCKCNKFSETFCKHFIRSFILEISFRKVCIDLNKIIFKPDGVNLQNHNNSVCNTALFRDKMKSMDLKLVE